VKPAATVPPLRAVAVTLLAALALAGCTGCASGSADDSADTSDPAPAQPGPRTPVSRIDVTRVQEGMELTLLRVERIGRGGRVFVRAYNGTDAPASVLSRDMVLVQGGERLRPSPDPIGRTPRFARVLEPGDSSAAVQYYRVLEPGPARLEVDWISRDLDISPTPFSFTFRVR
jgi:hypothetical protein